jgi:adenylate kinase
MKSDLRAILLFGPPGSGKGLQGKLLGAIPGLYHTAMGDVFRSLDKDSETGREFVNYSSQGKLVPDALTMKIWREHVDRQIEQGAFSPERDLLVLDGIPRTVEQVARVVESVDVKKVIHLDCPDTDTLVKRIRGRSRQGGGRIDDTKDDVIRHRLEVYENETRPVLEQAVFEGRIARIDGLGTPAEVLYSVLSHVILLMKK